jgi:wyosine [tRNA(Phe)-imidazoG37] synthetase (radical SAM superfamily)
MQQYQLVSRWIQGMIPGKILPWQIDLDTTNICNQSCYYCNTETFRTDKPVYQSLDSYLLLIEQFKKWREYDPNVIGTINNVIFSGGGEPTLLPGYHTVIESAIDGGFVTAINTNGTKLHKLLSINPDKIKRMAYIGLDIDSAVPETYEKIRRSKMTESPYERIKETAIELGNNGAPLDIKSLLLAENTSKEEIDALFKYAKEVNARSVHIRPGVINNESFVITDEIKLAINSASEKYRVKADVSLGRYDTRGYSKCHQFFLFPSFSADGNIYLCCEYKGREDLCIGSWVDDKIDWRELWCNENHKKIYNNFKTHFCKPCRPNTTNNAIQQNILNYGKIIEGFI